MCAGDVLCPSHIRGYGEEWAGHREGLHSERMAKGQQLGKGRDREAH